MKRILTMLSLFLTAALSAQIISNTVQVGFYDVTQNNQRKSVASVTGWQDGGREFIAVALTSDGTAIIDISDPAAPVEVGFIDIEPGSGKMYHVRYFSAGYLYTVAQPGPLQIIDVRNPDAPAKVTTFDDSSRIDEAYEVYVYEKRRWLIVTDTKGSAPPTCIYSIANPEVPVRIGSISVPFHHLVVRNDTLWGFKALTRVYDISDPAAPVLLHTQDFADPETDHSGYLDETGRYITSDHEYPPQGDVRIWDTSTFPMPMVSSIISSTGTQGTPSPHRSYWYGDFIFNSWWQDWLRVFNLSDVGAPYEAGVFDLHDPNHSNTVFDGSWDCEPFLASRTIALAVLKQGVYLIDFLGDGPGLRHVELDTVPAGALTISGFEHLGGPEPDTDNSAVYWRHDVDEPWQSVPVMSDHSFVLPAMENDFSYYLEVRDAQGRVTRVPGQAPHDRWFNVVVEVQDNALPVMLSFFSARPKNNRVELTWKTESEFNNSGFNVYRDGVLIGSHTTAPELVGHNGPVGWFYRWEDRLLYGVERVYELCAVDYSGREESLSRVKTFYSLEPGVGNVAYSFDLHSNYPNPFNAATTIRFDITTPEAVPVDVSVYSLLGHRVATVIKAPLETGSYSFRWNAGSLPSGVYYCRMSVPGFFEETRKLVLMR